MCPVGTGDGTDNVSKSVWDQSHMHILVEFLRCFHTCVMHNVAAATHEIYGEVFL